MKNVGQNVSNWKEIMSMNEKQFKIADTVCIHVIKERRKENTKNKGTISKLEKNYIKQQHSMLKQKQA